MTFMINHPRVLCIVCVFAMWLMALLGVWVRKRFKIPEEEDKGNLGIVVSATLTLLGLVIGFTFSMATTRYDQRKIYEEAEANAIGTEYVRADLLPAESGAKAKDLLARYTDARIAFYRADYGPKLDAANTATAALQTQLWATVRPQAAAQPTPILALVLSGMNDVLNSQGYTQSAWWNRIPVAAWGLLIVIAFFANGLVGYATQRSRSGKLLLLVLPIIVSVAFFLIADIDSPRGGLIRIAPRNLMSLAQSLHPSSQ